MSIVPPTTPAVQALRPFPWDNVPYTNVTPLTIRDNATLQWETEKIKQWIRDDLVPHVDGETAKLVAAWESNVNQLIEAVNNNLDNQNSTVTAQLTAQNTAIANQLSEQNDTVTAQLASNIAAVNAAVQEVIEAGITVSDPVISGVLNDGNSDSRADVVSISSEVFSPAVVIAKADATGSTSSVTAINAAITATPEGATCKVPSGTYLIDNPISIVNKSITLDLSAATLVKSADVAVISVNQSLGETVNVTSATATTFTNTSTDGSTVTTIPATQAVLSAAAPATWVRGELVKIVADNYVVGSREATAGGGADGQVMARIGQIMEIKSVVGNTVILDGSLNGTYSVNIRAALMPNKPVRIVGGTIKATPEVLALSSAGSGLINVRNAINPVIENMRLLRNVGPFIQWINCVNQLAVNNLVGYGQNDPAPSGSNAYKLGYGIICVNTQGGTTRDNQFYDLRHAFTDDVVRIQANDPDLSKYGQPVYHNFHDNYIQGTTSAAVSPHHGGMFHNFYDNTIVNCYQGYVMRGHEHVVEGGIVDGAEVAFETSSERKGTTRAVKFRNIRVRNVDTVFRLTGTYVDSSGNAIREIVPFEMEGIKASGIRKRIGGLSRAVVSGGNNSWKLGPEYVGSPDFNGFIVVFDSEYDINGDTIDVSESKINDGSGSSVAYKPVYEIKSAVNGSSIYGKLRIKNSKTVQQIQVFASNTEGNTNSVINLDVEAFYGWGTGYNTYIPSNLAAGSSLRFIGTRDKFSNGLVVVGTPGDFATSVVGEKIALIKASVVHIRCNPAGATINVSSTGWGVFATDPQIINIHNTGTTGTITIASANASFQLSAAANLVIDPGKAVQFVATNGKMKQLGPVS